MPNKQTNSSSVFARNAKAVCLFAGMFLLLVLSNQRTFAQNPCNISAIPVDFTGNPGGSFVSDVIVRDPAATCCNPPDNQCVVFDILVDPGTLAINFVPNGAPAFGSLFYQIDCGTPVNVNTPICINSPGHHFLSFCKPGGNDYSFTITSLTAPIFPPPSTTRVGCSRVLSVTGLTGATWNSTSPGAPGAYNSYLSCTNCATSTFTPQPGAPASIVYQVCGAPANSGCPNTPTSVCGNVTVNTVPQVTVDVQPPSGTINCNTSSSVTFTATATAGVSYLWSNGATTSAITVNSSGTYTVTVSSTLYNCTATATDFGVVTKDVSVPNLSCGNSVCLNQGAANICATANGGTTFAWSGPGIVGASTGSCINVNASGDYDVVATKTSSGCTQTCTKVVTTPNLSCGPTAYLFCDITDVDLCATAVNGSSFDWSGPGIVGNSHQRCVKANFPGTYTVTATTPQGCSETCTQEVRVLQNVPNCDEYCTRTQGYFGNTKGKLCDGRKSIRVVADLLSYGPLTVGDGARSITFGINEASCLNADLPAGGPPAILPLGNVDCAGASGLKYLKNGRFNNVFIGQTVTLSLNTRMDLALGYLQMTGQYLTTYAADNCVNGQSVPGTLLVFHISPSVLNYLGVNNTVKDLLDLANKALGGTYIPGPGDPTLSEISGAADAINNAFDDCRILVEFSDTYPIRNGSLLETTTTLNGGVRVYPNPFADQAIIEITPSKDQADMSLDIYNMSGQKVYQANSGAVKANKTYNWSVSGQNLARGIYFYSIRAGEETYKGKMVLIKN